MGPFGISSGKGWDSASRAVLVEKSFGYRAQEPTGGISGSVQLAKPPVQALDSELALGLRVKTQIR